MSLLLAALLSVPAFADILVPTQFETIQEAVDAAVTGDVVVVSPGVYVETVDVATDGITLRGKKATIDAEFGGPCVTVNADDVTIEGFSLINGGDVLTVTDTVSYFGDGATIRDVEIASGAGIGVRIDGGDVTIENTDVTGVLDAGVRIFGATAQSATLIDRVTVRGSGRGISANGGSYRVFNCTIERVDGIGIELVTTSTIGATQVRSNRLTAIGGNGIEVDSDAGGFTELLFNRVSVVDGVGILIDSADGDVDVVRSVVESTADVGIDVASVDFLFVADNTVRDVASDGIVAAALATDSGILEGNRVSDVGGDGISTAGFGMTVLSNRVGSTLGAGIVHDGLNVEIVRNRVRGAGRQGLVHSGNGGLIERNTIQACVLDGILFSGSSNTVIDNRSTGNGGDGIDLHEFAFIVTNANNSIVDNVATGNAHEGIDATGTATAIDGNRVSGNGGLLGPQIAGAGNDVDGDDSPDGTVSSFVGNKIGGGPQAPGDPFTAQRLDIGEG